jgi:hypothetical protein
MSDLRWLVPMAVLSVLLTGADGLADPQPTLLPTRDVDIRYDVTRPQKPKVRFYRDGHVVTMLTPANRTFRTVDQALRRPSEPAPGAALTRGGDAVIAGLPCTDWSWSEDGEKHTLCLTADGVTLRLVVDEQTFREARSVKYAPQKPSLFQVPVNYAPAIAPEGAGEP